MNKCSRCLLPAAAPGADIDAGGICAFCREHVPRETPATARARYRQDLEDTLCSAQNHSHSDYDCLVPFSGGKDSLYLLHRLKRDYGLRVLAYTCNIDLPDAAWSNIRTALSVLDIDHIVHAPAPGFLRKLFAYLLRNQEARGAVYTVSYVYAPIFEGSAIRLAIEKNIPLVLAGYSPGQPEPERMLYEFAPELIRNEDWTPPHLKECGAFTDEDLSHFYNPLRLPADSVFPRYLAPFHAWDYDQNEVMKAVFNLGLIKRRTHASPIVSNYPINWLMMYSDLRHFGYNPYAPEFSALIREGKANLNYWRIMAPAVDFMIRSRVLLGRDVTRSLRWLEMKDHELAIRLPKGAYDPPLIRSRTPVA